MKTLAASTLAGTGSLATLAALAAPTAAASEIPPLTDLITPLTDIVQPAAPAPTLPTLPPPVIPQDLATLPANLLRTDRHNLAHPITYEPAPAAPPAPDQVADAVHAYTHDPIRQVIGHLSDTSPIHLDHEAIAQAAVAIRPTPNLLQELAATASTLAETITSGQAVQDLHTVAQATLASEDYQAWRNGAHNPFNPQLTGEEGIAAAIDAATTNPTGLLHQIMIEAGGPLRLLHDPVAALSDVITRIAGDDALPAVTRFITDQLGPDIAGALRDAAPALLTIPAAGLIGALTGAPLGALTGAGIGAVLGALAPHNLLGGLLGALAGAGLGALTTAIPTALGSALLLLPTLILGPLLGATGASALALAVSATVTFGTWLIAVMAPAALASLGIGAALGVAATIILFTLALANPAAWFAAPGAGILVFLFTAFFLTGATALLTGWIPAAIFLVTAPLLTLGALALGGILGLLGAALTTLAGIPLLTALGAIPGAILGSIPGALLGTGISSLLSALAGAGLGALTGGLLGALTGAGIGGALGLALAIPTYLTLAWILLDRRARAWQNGPLADLTRLITGGWNTSHLKKLLDRAHHEWDRTTTGRALAHGATLIDHLRHIILSLDPTRLRNLLLRGAIPGAIAGAIPGGTLGALLGGLLGAFHPANLLTGGLPGAIAGALPGALIGAGLGGLLGPLAGLITGLGSIPLTFLPNLLGLGTLWTLAGVFPLAAWASTLIPAVAIATAAWLASTLLITAPLWIPLVIVDTIATIIMHLAFGALMAAPLLVPILGAGVPVAALAGAVAGIAGAIAGIGSTIMFAGIALAAAAMLVVVGIPAFLLTALLFTFPAGLATLAWIAGYPFLLPMALGASLLEAILIASATAGLTDLVTIPAGAGIGALTGAGIGGILGTAVNSLIRALTYGTTGAGVGAAAGAGIGAVLGALTALLTHLRAHAEWHGDTFVAEAKVVPSPLLDSLPIPGVGPTSTTPPERIAVPTIADPAFATGITDTRDRILTGVNDLVAA